MTTYNNLVDAIGEGGETPEVRSINVWPAELRRVPVVVCICLPNVSYLKAGGQVWLGRQYIYSSEC